MYNIVLITLNSQICYALNLMLPLIQFSTTESQNGIIKMELTQVNRIMVEVLLI